MNPTSRLEAEIDGLYATIEGLTGERDRGLARLAELERLARRYATLGHAPSCLQVTAVGDCVCGYADLMVAPGVERPDGVEHVSEDARRLAELERLAREVVRVWKASNVWDTVAIDELAAFLQPETPTPETKGEGTIAVRKQHRVGCLTPEHYCPCPLVPVKPETKERTWRIEVLRHDGPEGDTVWVTALATMIVATDAESALHMFAKAQWPHGAPCLFPVGYRAIEVTEGT